MMQYNKGEWSELYALLVIFNERSIPAADHNLNETKERYDFLEVIREDAPGRIMHYNLEKDGVVEVLDDNKHIKRIVTIDDLPSKTRRIFEKIKSNNGGTFSIDEAIELMKKYDIDKVKAESNKKSDIDAIVRDKITTRSRLGFSVKSQLGGASTLLNTSTHTALKYKVDDINDISEINKIDGIKNRIKAINDLGGKIEFSQICSPIFKGNLRMIDTVLPSIMADMVISYYSGMANKIADLCEIISQDNPFELTKDDIDFKVKNFLRAVALGMVPGKPWNARLTAYGGYIIVKDTGELVCYHLYNDDDFKDYLYENTKLDTPDAKRHDFGYLYEEDGEKYIDLNFQIRFKK